MGYIAGPDRAHPDRLGDPADLRQDAGVDWPRRRPGIDALSDGRMILGLGASGPQVIEGWHGVPYDRPLQPHEGGHRDLPPGLAPGASLVNDGDSYPLPLPPGQGTGLGKPLKMHRPSGAAAHPGLRGLRSVRPTCS